MTGARRLALGQARDVGRQQALQEAGADTASLAYIKRYGNIIML